MSRGSTVAPAAAAICEAATHFPGHIAVDVAVVAPVHGGHIAGRKAFANPTEWLSQAA